MASVAKRIRTTLNALAKPIAGDKRVRLEAKLAFLRSLSPHVSFKAGAKIQGEGGYRA